MRQRDDIKALRTAAIEVLLHRCCWCAREVPMCDRCVRAFDALAELVGMKTPAEEVTR